MKTHALRRIQWIVVALAFAAAAVQLTAAPRACKGCYWTRYWPVSPTLHKSTDAVSFPETSRLQQLRPNDLGVAFSGGGTRSAAATLGQLRALVDNKWMDNVRYVAAVSGGTWAAVPFTYSPQSEDELLRFPRDFSELTPAAIAKTAKGSLAYSIAHAKLGIPGAEEALEILLRARAGSIDLGSVQVTDLVDRLFGNSGGPDTTYTDILRRLFIRPHLKDRADDLFGWDGDSQNEIVKRNSVLGAETFVRPVDDRPFLIAGGTMFYTHPAFEYPRLIPVEYTPLYTGVRQQYGPNLGGGYVWPWAYDGEIVGPPDGDYVRVRLDLKRRRFTLSDVVASSGAAPQLFLFRNPRFRQAADLFPAFDHYTVRGSEGAEPMTQGVRKLMHGDGGFTDNLGLMPLLARQVRNIIVFVNGKNDFDQNISVRSLFFPIDELDDSGGDRSMNVVFKPEEYEEMKTGLAAAVKTGPAVFCMTNRDVQPNELYNIQGYKGLNICWVFNRAVPAWASKLPPDTQKRVAESGSFARFPWFRTFGENIPSVTKLRDEQVILLAHLSYWNISNPETRDVIRKALAGARLE